MNKKRLTLTAMVLMAVFSFLGLLALLGNDHANLTSITLIIGIVFYFVTGEPKEKDSMSLKAVPRLLRDWKLDLLILMPLAMDIICYAIARRAVPEFLDHLWNRIDFLSFGTILLLIAELAIAALGEEIAWRGFFQKQLTKSLPLPPALLITAVLFAICHFTIDSFAVVLYDLLFIVIDAIFFGLVYRRSNNVIVCTLSHFLANFISVFALLLFR